jgi:hypothetical protein
MRSDVDHLPEAEQRKLVEMFCRERLDGLHVEAGV